jgi:hypothetical protein
VNRRRWRAALLLATLVALLAAQPAAAGSAPSQNADSVVATVTNVAPEHSLPAPDPLTPRLYRPFRRDEPPAGFAFDAIRAEQIANATSAVREARAKYGQLHASAYLSPLVLRQGHFWHWDIYYAERDGKPVVEVELHPTSGRVLQVTKSIDIGWPLLIGVGGVLGGKLNAPWIWLPLCVVFLLPFFDPRRPLRLLHLDLLMLLGFGISQFFFTRGQPDLSVPLVYPFLLYAAARALWAAFRPARRSGALMPLLSTRLLVIGLVVLVALRIAFAVTSASTLDISTAGVIGADRIEHGLELYVNNSAHGDTYGPVNYLMYVPSELVFPFKGDATDAARAATLTFDLLTVLGLFLLGRSLRSGAAGRRLGLGLAWAWCAFPYTALVIASTTNDALVPLFAIYALVFLRSPPARGFFAGLGAMAKFAPALLAPALFTGRGPIRLKQVLVAGTVFTAVVVALVIWFLPAGGLRELWDTTLGFQLHRTSPLSIWTRHPAIDFLRPVFSVLGVALAVLAAFVPRRRTVGQVAALCAAILAVAQIPTNYWLYFYVVWFAPFLFVALFEEYRSLGPNRQDSTTSDFVKPPMISQPASVTATRSSIRTPSTSGR